MQIKADSAVYAMFLFLAGLYFSFLAKNDLILCGPQQFYLNHPLQLHWLTQFFNGNLPWISNSVAGGIPLWGDPNLGIFYSGNFLYLILPFNTAWNASLIFHLFWGPCGLYWLCRKFQLPVTAALTAGLAFLFSSPLLVALNSSEILMTASWVPWIAGLTYFGLQQDLRKTVLASVSLSFQWLAGYTFVQAATLIIVGFISIWLIRRKTPRVFLSRLMVMIFCAVLLTAIQWLPALIWYPHAENPFLLRSDWSTLPYVGWLVLLPVLFGLRNKIVWLALIFAVIDFSLLQGSPLLPLFLGGAAAIGTAKILVRYPCFPAFVIPLLVALELLIVNWGVARILPVNQVVQKPLIMSAIPDFTHWNIYNSGTRSALSPIAGLHWDLKYALPPEQGLMVWKPLRARAEHMEESLKDATSLNLFRNARVGYVISDVHFNHPELGLVKQKATKFFVHRLRIPVSSVVTSSNGPANIRWTETAPHSMVIESTDPDSSELTIYRNALPGWKCRMQDQMLPIGTDAEGWMKIKVPAGKNRLDLTYRAPGAAAGTILTAIGTILILAILLL